MKERLHCKVNSNGVVETHLHGKPTIRKALKIMKLTVAILLTLGLQVSLASRAQEVTISGQNSNLKSVLQSIRKQTGCFFIYNNEVIKESVPVNLNLKNVELKDALFQIFKNQPLTYHIEKNIIVLKLKNIGGPEKVKIINVEGKVIDDKNVPMSGVTVAVKESGITVVTNGNGIYKIKAEENQTLIFSYVGYKQQEISIGTRDRINVQLNMSSSELNEMVVIGYGSQERKLLTGAIAEIKGDELTASPAVNISSTLMGRVTGLVTTMSTGAPDRDRGTLKLRGMGEALVVIDGVARDGVGLIGMELDKLDANAIESITVLKDASAAIYGARGANGVVLVTTKRGKAGKVSLNYNANLGLQQPTRLPRFLDSYNYALLNNEMYDNDKVEKGSSPRTKYTDQELQKFRDGSDPDRYANTNWYDEVLKASALTQRHNLSLNGGTVNSRYFISGSYTNQGGLINTVGLKRYSIVSNFDLDVTKNTSVSVGLNYVNELVNNPSAYAENIFGRLSGISPTLPSRFMNGNYAYYSAGNPLTDMMEDSGYNRNSRSIFTGSLKISQKIPFVPGLSANGTVTVDKNNSFQKAFTIPFPQYTIAQNKEEYSQQNASQKPSLSETYNENNNVNLLVSLNYKRNFDKHNFNAFILYEQNESGSETLSASRSNFPVSSFDQLLLGDLNTQRNNGSSTEGARQSIVSRFAYNYAGRYILESNFRYDGSPNYPKGKRRAIFPSIAAAWMISEEDFIKDKYDYVDLLKLRSSYGQLGNDGGTPFSYFYTYALLPTGYVFGTSDAISPLTRISNSSVPNTNITWEKVNSFDLGLDVSLWNGLFSMEADYYNKSKYDILRSRGYQVPGTFGLSSALENFGRERYYGYEFALGHQNKIGAVDYSARVNMTYTKSKVIDYGENDTMLPGLRQEGSPVGTSRILLADGIFRDQDDVNNWPKYVTSPGGVPVSGKPGDIKYVDLNGDGIVELYSGSADRNYGAKYITPPTVYGVSLGMKWRRFAADVFLQAATGVYINFTAANDLANFYEIHLDRWTPENLNGSYPRLLSNYEPNRYPSTFFVKNGDYLKLRTAQVSYTLPFETLKPAGISSFTITAQGQNLFTINKNKRFDPEVTGSNATSYPPQKIFSFGIRLGL